MNLGAYINFFCRPPKSFKGCVCVVWRVGEGDGDGSGGITMRSPLYKGRLSDSMNDL